MEKYFPFRFFCIKVCISTIQKTQLEHPGMCLGDASRLIRKKRIFFSLIDISGPSGWEIPCAWRTWRLDCINLVGAQNQGVRDVTPRRIGPFHRNVIKTRINGVLIYIFHQKKSDSKKIIFSWRKMILKILILKKSRKCWFFQVKFILKFTWKNQNFRLFFEIEIFKIIFLHEKKNFFGPVFFYDLEFTYTFDLAHF